MKMTDQQLPITPPPALSHGEAAPTLPRLRADAAMASTTTAPTTMTVPERDYSNSCAESAYTYGQIANDWHLWQEYVDPDAVMSRDEFDAMSIKERIVLQIDAYGPE